MQKYFLLALVASLAFLGASCNQNQEITFDNSTSEPAQEVTAPEVQEPMNIQPPEELLQERVETNSDSKEGPIAVMKTTLGDVKIQLFEEATPKTVESFITLANQDFYDGILFHRVIPGFMIQGGDPLTKQQPENRRVHGTGGPGYQFGDEINLHQNLRGTLSMANAGPNTNGSQFFINVADNNFLDGRHAVFGEVIEGMDVVDKISQVSRDAADHPVDDVEIVSLEISE